jgi:tetratricopeptide (TPR) repeat protein
VKQTIITALVFASVGFLAGYSYHAHRTGTSAAHLDAAAAAEAAPGPATPEPAAAQGLPPGHPPVDSASVVRLFEDEAARNPQNPEPRLKLANFYYDQRQWEQAVFWYQKALELDPENADARTDLGTCYFNLGQAQQALREFDKALAANPKHAATLYNMVVVHLHGTHNLAAAQQALDRLKAIDPHYPNLEALKRDIETARATLP